MSMQDPAYSHREQGGGERCPDGDIDPAGEAGWYLRRERERAGYSLEEAGAQCGVHPVHIAAIESGDLTQLPGRSETLGIVGAYARFLKFDPQPLVLHYAHFLPLERPRPRVPGAGDETPRPLGSAKVIPFSLAGRLKAAAASGGGVVASALVAVVLFGVGIAWLMPGGDNGHNGIEIAAARPQPAQQNDSGRDVNGRPGEIVSSITSLTEKVLNDSTPDAARPKGENAAGPTPSPAGGGGIGALIAREITHSGGSGAAGGEDTLKHEAPANAATVEDTSTPPPASVVGRDQNGRIFGAENKTARLVLKARDNIWIRIEDKKGNLVMTQTLMKGDRYKVPTRPGLSIITRDGGALSYAVDGVDKGTLGGSGEILVGRSLDLADLGKNG